MANIRDVAARAGVSPATVSNVLNRPTAVAPATRDRVRHAIDALQFVPNGSARHVRLGRGRVLGLVVPDLGNPFFTDLARSVDAVAAAAGMTVILCNSDHDPAREASYLDLLERHRVRGVLITPAGEDPSDRLLALRRRGILVTLLDCRAWRPDVCSVSVDNQLGGELATRHLIEAGHRRIAFVAGPWRLAQVRQRYHGCLRSIRTAGLADEHLVCVGTGSGHVTAVTAGRDAAHRILTTRQATRPTAVICASDLLALGVLQGLTQRGVPVPDGMAIVGYDDIPFAAAAAVPLSSVRQPRHELGRTAVQLLLAEAADPARHQHRQVVLTPELVARESSQPAVAPYRRRIGADEPDRPAHPGLAQMSKPPPKSPPPKSAAPGSAAVSAPAP